jgi:hypothetical protein
MSAGLSEKKGIVKICKRFVKEKNSYVEDLKRSTHALLLAREKILHCGFIIY